MTSLLKSSSPRRGATVVGLFGVALASVLLLCGAGNVPVENFTPQGAMQADLNAGGHSVTNAATINATNVVVSGTLTAPHNGTNQMVQTDGNGLLPDSVFRTSKLIYVSQSRGSDTRTGLSKYSQPTPFATLTAAAAAAVAGDTIEAEDGAFADRNLVLVTGVSWVFLPGATIAATGASASDAIFKDGGTAANTTVSGCGQVFTLTSTIGSGDTFYGVTITGASNVTFQGISFSVTDTASSASTVALSSANASAVITVTGSLNAQGGAFQSTYGVYSVSPGCGTITVNGNVGAIGGNPAGNGYGYYCSSSTNTGTLTVTGRLSGSSAGESGSTAGTVTCGSLGDGSTAMSTANNRLVILNPVPVVLAAVPVTGFSQSFSSGAQDQILALAPTGTLASGTVTLPNDVNTRIGERLTVATTQTITSLAVAVPSGTTLYGYTTGTLSPGSITFIKSASNVWFKL